MRVLFISSGNSKTGISPLIHNQGKSIEKLGIDIEYYTVIGKGLKGYLSNIPKLYKYIKRNKYDIFHAHYSLIGIIASLSGAKPMIVSLMGSDIYEFRWLRFMTKIFSRFFWKLTIVKSERMRKFLKLHKANVIVIPNGIDLTKFKVFPEEEIYRKIPRFDKKQVLFIGSPVKKEKNMILAKQAFDKLDNINAEFLNLYNIENELIPYYMNAASALILTSLWEGSPNVIKEAMACNLPIVTVNVGDVNEIIGDTEGCFITEGAVEEVSEKLNLALNFGRRTNGRDKIIKLSSENIARQIIECYKCVQQAKNCD